jgi:hypothetical protein
MSEVHVLENGVLTYVKVEDPDVELTQDQLRLIGLQSLLAQELGSAEFRIYAQERDGENRFLELECEFVIERDNFQQWQAINEFALTVGASISMMDDGYGDGQQELILYDATIRFPMDGHKFSDIKNKKQEMLELIKNNEVLLKCIHRVY